jgi:hypothetical protein
MMSVALAVLVGLIILPGASVPVGSSPSGNFGVGLHLEEYSIEMLLSTEQDTVRVVPGWVDVTDMRLGETVSVQLSSTGYYYLYAGPDPQWFLFERDGRQYFNLTLTLKEDAPLYEDNKILLSATAKTYLDQAISDVELVVTLTFQFTATASLVTRPPEAGPGGVSEGVLKVTNTGSIYGVYHLKVASDPDSVVTDVSFRWEADLTPGFYDDFPFRVEVAGDAPSGKHRVTIEVWGTTQYDTGDLMDTFTVEVQVSESSWLGTGTALVSAIVIVAIIGAAAYALRRKA